MDTDTVTRMQKRLNALPSQENAVTRLRHTIMTAAAAEAMRVDSEDEDEEDHAQRAAEAMARASRAATEDMDRTWADVNARRNTIFRTAVGAHYVPGKPRQDYITSLPPKPDREEIKMSGRVRIADPPPMTSPAARAPVTAHRSVWTSAGKMATPSSPVSGDAKLTERDALAGIIHGMAPSFAAASGAPGGVGSSMRVDPEDHLVGEALVAPQTRESYASLDDDATWIALSKSLTNAQRNTTGRAIGKSDVLLRAGLRARTPQRLVRAPTQEQTREWDAAVQADELQSRANDAPTLARNAEFVRQVAADLQRQLSEENIYQDAILDETERAALKKNVVRGDGVMRQEYVPASTHQTPPPRVSELSADEMSILRHRMTERGHIFKRIAEQNARQFKAGDGYEKRNLNRGLQMHLEGPEVPLTTMERLADWRQQFPEEAMTEGKGIYRPCCRGENCIGRNITRAHLGLATATRTPVAQTVMSGYTTLQAQTNPHNAPPPVRPHPSEMGFTLAAYMTDDEVDYCKRTGRRFDVVDRTCVLCHICDVSQQYDNITETENLPIDPVTNAVRPLNLFRVEVDRPGAYSSAVCLQPVASWGVTGIVGHFPRFSCEHYGYGERHVGPDKVVKCIIEHGMGFRPSSAK